MKFGDALTFREDIFFDGAVQADWFYQEEKSRLVAENFVFHGRDYFGAGDETGRRTFTDTVQFVRDIVGKVAEEQRVNPLTLAIAGYGTGKSHLAVTLAELLSGAEYHPETYRRVIGHIANISPEAGREIASCTQRPNLVLVLNGMRDFNLHYELLKAAQRSLQLYGCSDEKLKSVNRALDTASRFFERNAHSDLFPACAAEHGYSETGEELVERLRRDLKGDDIETAFEVVNAAYERINGHEIRWDEGVSASAVLETLLREYCGISGPFHRIVILFDEFGRYLEFASSATAAQSGDSALQQIFECAQNAEGGVQVVNLIQSDIKTYLQRVDRTSNVSRYIGRYDASDKYRLSSNLETIFANLIERKDKAAFAQIIQAWQSKRESVWQDIFAQLNRWIPVTGIWKDYALFRRVAVEGIYPLHPLSSYMLSQLSDYLQNRSSLILLSGYVRGLSEQEILEGGEIPLIYPETLLNGDLFVEMLSAEEEGRQYSQHCIRYQNILRKHGDKLSEKSRQVLRANLAVRILRCRTESYADVKKALSLFSGLGEADVSAELEWLENEYAVLGYDERACCLDFLEDSSGAHDFRTFFRRMRAGVSFTEAALDETNIRNFAGIADLQPTQFATTHRIKTNEWQFEQDLFSIRDLSAALLENCLNKWKGAVSPEKPKGQLLWLYLNRETEEDALDNARRLAQKLTGSPIVLMLLDDADGRLENALCDYLTLRAVSDADRQKFGRHYEEKAQQTEENIRNAFDLLKKEKQRITPDGVAPMGARLPIALAEIFAETYPRALPFDFDGFDSKQPGKARKAFCSITRLLLSGPLHESAVRAFPSDVRNRLEATLFPNSAFSWKVISENYQIVPPGRRDVLSVYRELEHALPEGGSIPLNALLDKWLAPPYGMNDYAAVYMLAAFCANLGYCLRVILNESVYGVQAWKDEVIQDNKIDLPLIRQSVLKRVNAGAVADQYLRLFAKIDGLTDTEQAEPLSRQLDALKQAEELPEALSAQYQLARMKLQEGNRVKKAWNNAEEAVMSKYDLLLERRDIYAGLQAMEALKSYGFYNCFADTGYKISEAQKERIANLHKEIQGRVEPFLSGWIAEQRCKSVEKMSQYQTWMGRVQKLLNKVGYSQYAALAEKQASSELSSKEEIRARQELRKNCNEYASRAVTAAVPYTLLQEWKKRGEALLEQLKKYAPSMGKDGESLRDAVSEKAGEIAKAVQRISDDMNDIYADMDAISCAEDVEDMIERIRLVRRKGIPSNDERDFHALQDTLQEFYMKIEAWKGLQDDREQFQRTYEDLKRLYGASELEFDVLPILDGVADGIAQSMNRKERAWREQYLQAPQEDRSSLLMWIERTKILPGYLSEETRAEYLRKKERVEEKLSEAKIEDAIFYFKRLNRNERAVCLEKLSLIFSETE